MKLENSFRVDAPPERAWELLMDVPRVIPCMPGTELTETVDDTAWKAKMTVKLGPISLQFATDVKREEADAEGGRAVLTARAREMRGRGGGQARIVSALAPVDGGTRVDISTELTLAGPVAQYGRGMVEDVSTQLVRRFADCLAAELGAGGETDVAAGAAQGAQGAQQSAQTSDAPRQARPVAGLRLFLGVVTARIGRLVRRRTS